MPPRVRLLLREKRLAQRLIEEVLEPEGFTVDPPEAEPGDVLYDIAIVDPRHPVAQEDGKIFAFAVVAYVPRLDEDGWRQALSLGAVEVLSASWTAAEARRALRRAAERASQCKAAWQRSMAQWLRQQPWLTLFHELPVGLVMMSESGAVFWANATAAQWLECLEEREKWHCPPLPLEVQQCIEQARVQRVAHNEVVLPQNGQVLSMLAVADEKSGVLLFLQDVSRLKAMEAQRGQWLQNISLQLRSPLTAILGYAELLEHVGPLTQAQREFVERIGQSVRTMVDALEKLLEISRIEAGVDMAWEIVPLGPLLTYTVTTMQPKAAAKGIHFEVRLPEGLPAVQGPPARLRYVFDHLVSDAIRYTPSGGRVTLEAEVAEEQVIVRVQDTGVGIPQAEIPHIFEKFYRATNVATKFAGSGLGLSLAHSIVTQVGGRIWVESEEGRGTTFTVVLPVASPSPQPLSSASQSKSTS